MSSSRLHDRLPSDAISVKPEDLTKTQLDIYFHGTAKVPHQDELRTSKNRSKNCVSPKSATKRQLSMYRNGVSKLRNDLAKKNASDMRNIMVPSSRHYSSPANNDFSQKHFQELHCTPVQNTSQKMLCGKNKEISKTITFKKGRSTNLLTQRYNSSGSQHPRALEELEEELWKAHRPKRAQPLSEFELSEIGLTTEQSHNIINHEELMASKQVDIFCDREIIEVAMDQTEICDAL